MIRRAGLFSALVTIALLLMTGVAQAASCEINGPDQYTDNPRVTVSFDTDGHAQYRISNDDDMYGVVWQPARSRYDHVEWMLESGFFSGDGKKTVYMEFRDPDDEYPQECDDDIILDTKPPTTKLWGAPWRWARSARLTLSASDPDGFPSGWGYFSGVDYTEYAFSSVGPWQRYSFGVEIDDESEAQFYYRSVDKAGNVEAVRSEELRVDSVGPSCRARSVTVKRGSTCRVYYYASENHGTFVKTWVRIKNAGGSTKAMLTSNYDSPNQWEWNYFTCNLKRGTYTIVVTAQDEVGNWQTRKGEATLKVR